jgi:hypothetical protein
MSRSSQSITELLSDAQSVFAGIDNVEYQTEIETLISAGDFYRKKLLIVLSWLFWQIMLK